MMWLPDGEKFLKICIYVSTESTNMTDRWTDRWTDGRTLHDGIGRAYALHRSAKHGQSNLTKSASRGVHSLVRGHPRGSKFVPLNSWGGGSY